MGASERTMTDPVHYGSGNGNGNAHGSYNGNSDTTSGFARPPTSETAPEQQV
jgi:hypothetical protein